MLLMTRSSVGERAGTSLVQRWWLPESLHQWAASADRQPLSMNPDLAHPGHLEVHLAPAQRLGPVRVPGADLVLVIRAGQVTVELAPSVTEAASDAVTVHASAGDAVPLERGTPFAVLAGARGSVLDVTARPRGPEVFLSLAARRPAPPLATLVSAAVEQGVELLPAWVQDEGQGGNTAR